MTSRPEISRPFRAVGPINRTGWWTFLFLALFLLGATAFGFGLSGPRPERAWQAFLVNTLFWSGLAFGSVLFSAALVMTKGRWGRPLKRLAEAPAAFLPFSCLLFGVLFFGRDKIFPWIREPLPEKASWLNIRFLFARDGLGLLVLTALSLALVYYSVRGERDIPLMETEDWKAYQHQGVENLKKQAVLSPLLGIVFALVLSLIGFDWVMSLSPHWNSTLFGMYFFTGAFYSALAALMFLSILSLKIFKAGDVIQGRQFHDLGKLLLGFCLVSGDFFFSQFVVIWYGNLPEETRFVILRVNSAPWKPLAWTVLILSFALPFIILLSKKAKMRPGIMLLVSAMILIGLWLERFLLVAPSLWKGNTLPLGLSEGLISLGFLGLMALCLLWFFNRFPWLPLSDPLFQDSLELDGKEVGQKT
jgi:Ni/Fe-hydrogenase subunit HybB-like protein